MSMLTQQRRDVILRILGEEGSVTVSELIDKLDSSESTIRRDLVALDKAGKLNKVHGGATSADRQYMQHEPDIEEKLKMNIAEKKMVAAYAAKQISDHDFVYLDAGTTTLLIIDYLNPSLDVSFVTNGIVHARELVKRGFKTFVLGGELKSTTEAVIGLAAVNNLNTYNFSKAFIGVNGISVKNGYTTPDTEEAFLKTAAIERSFVSYVVADSSKFGKVSTVTFASLDASAIITDAVPDSSFEDHTVISVAPALETIL